MASDLALAAGVSLLSSRYAPTPAAQSTSSRTTTRIADSSRGGGSCEAFGFSSTMTMRGVGRPSGGPSPAPHRVRGAASLGGFAFSLRGGQGGEGDALGGGRPPPIRHLAART